MSYLASDAIWTAITERITGVNTIGPTGRVMPTTGAARIKCDRVANGPEVMQQWRTLGCANASVEIAYSRHEGSPSQGGNIYLYLLTVTVAVSYNLTSQAALGPTYQVVKSLAQRHSDMLDQALSYTNAMLVTQAAGKAWDGSTLASGTATGIVGGSLFYKGMTITRDDGDQSDLYETEHVFTGTANVAAATS